MLRALALACLFLAALPGWSWQLSDMVLNEIMYAPSAPEPEWIEILNRGNEPVNLKRWQISDATATRHLLPSSDLVLAAGGYLLLSKDSSALNDARGAPPCAVISVSGFPSLNNGGDAMVLRDAEGRTVDSLTYRPEWGGNAYGCSLERRDADASSTEPDNWGTCASASRATPGLPNSIRRLGYDLSLSGARVAAGFTHTLAVVIRNSGKRAAEGYALMVYDDSNFDSLAVTGELTGQWTAGEPLLPGDSISVSLELSLSPGVHQIIAVADFPVDERPTNNQAVCTALRPFVNGTLLVNEIMADPLPGRSEYIECINGGEHDIDLRGWRVADLAGSDQNVLISAATRVIHPGEILVLAMDSTLLEQFPSLATVDLRCVVILRGARLNLNNDGDAVVIRDPLGVVIDSVQYSASWHNPDLSDPVGRSLERIRTDIASNDQRNWSTCVDPAGGTPGLRNSVTVDCRPVASRLACTPNPFSPDADGIDDVTVIQYEMPLQTSVVNLKIYDVRGRLIRRLASNEPGGSAGSIIWDGRDDSGAIARIGVYIALLEAVNSAGGLESARGLLVLARRL